MFSLNYYRVTSEGVRDKVSILILSMRHLLIKISFILSYNYNNYEH